MVKLRANLHEAQSTVAKDAVELAALRQSQEEDRVALAETRAALEQSRVGLEQGVRS